MIKTYQGKCHCGSTSFKVDAELKHSFKCNCSFCVRRASTLVKVDEAEFKLESKETEMGVYGARKFSKHYFCKTCGIQCYTRFKSENGQSVIVNVGCLEGVDSYALTPSVFDGANKL